MSFFQSLSRAEKEEVKTAVFVDLLQKNIPAELIYNEVVNLLHCPRCNEAFWDSKFVTKFCPNCGQAIKPLDRCQSPHS